ncbi:MAG TPA: bifunctional homocysteine S-methyltransferase/methylenetetrahydrofolate reductase [Gemmatimonadales bacterium]|jgi:homocysteine S-methyltransferase
MSRFRELIMDRRVHVLDGAMGTFLYSRGVFVNVCYDELNISQPSLIRDVHDRYLRVGAEAIETNTFGANPVKLSSWGLEDRTEELNRAGATIARDAAGSRASVLGAVGPLGIRIEPWGPTSRDEAVGYFVRQISGLIEGGVDGLILETFGDLDELHTAIIAARQACDLPVVAQVTITEEGATAYGSDPEKVARALTEWGADVVGVNCSVGPAIMLEAVERMAAVTDRPLSAQPNAGMPRVVGDRKIYLSSPDYMATYAMRMMEAGARFVGGCCGTTPDHIHAMRLAVRQRRPRPSGELVRPREAEAEGGVDPVPLDRRSRWGAKLARGEWVVSVELLPPKGASAGRLIEQAQRIKVSGADAVSILDGARAQSHMGVIPSALVVERQVGIETIAHYTCRDRNMLGMISDLVGAAAAGLRNLLIVTGDPPRTGPYGDATAVFDIDAIGLTNLVDRLNHGLDPGGNPIGEPTQWVIGVAANHAAANLDTELRRLHWKIDAGADYVITQPVFDPRTLAAFLEMARPSVPVIAGLWPLASLRNAEFLANEMPGVVIPPEIMRRMAQAQERGEEAAAAEGIAIAREVRDAVHDLVQGVHVSVPFGNVELAVGVLMG